MKKVYLAIIYYTFLEKSFLKKEYKVISEEYPHLLYSLSEQSARNEVVYSDFWKHNDVCEGRKNCQYIEKELHVHDMSEMSLLYLMDNMKPKDFVAYLKQLWQEV